MTNQIKQNTLVDLLASVPGERLTDQNPYNLMQCDAYLQAHHQCVLGKRETLDTFNIEDGDSLAVEFAQADEHPDQTHRIADLVAAYEQHVHSKVQGWLVLQHQYYIYPMEDDYRDHRLATITSGWVTEQPLSRIVTDCTFATVPHNWLNTCEAYEIFINHDPHFILGPAKMLVSYYQGMSLQKFHGDSMFEDMLINYYPVTQAWLANAQNAQQYQQLLAMKAFTTSPTLLQFRDQLTPLTDGLNTDK